MLIPNVNISFQIDLLTGYYLTVSMKLTRYSV